MLLNEIISHVKTILSAGPRSDDSRLSDRLIYATVKKFRNKLAIQKANKLQYISPYNYKTIPCVCLEKVDKSECPDIWESGCSVYRSTLQIPTILADKKGLLVERIRNLYGSSIKLYDTLDEVGQDDYSRTRASIDKAYIRNGYLYLVSKGVRKTISISAMFEDPLDLTIAASSWCCGVAADITPCYDIMTEDFPIDAEILDVVLTMSRQELMEMYRTIEDTENDNDMPHPSNPPMNGQ